MIDLTDNDQYETRGIMMKGQRDPLNKNGCPENFYTGKHGEVLINLAVW